jgi:hypothetical protein
MVLELSDEGGSAAGKLSVAMRYLMPLNEHSISISCRCRPGLHWTEDVKDVKDPVGTVLGYRKSDGARFGKCPAKIPNRCALVKWDWRPEKTELCSIGRLNDEGAEVYDLALDPLHATEEAQKKQQEAAVMKKKVEEQARKEMEKLQQNKISMKYKADAAEAKRLEEEAKAQEEQLAADLANAGADDKEKLVRAQKEMERAKKMKVKGEERRQKAVLRIQSQLRTRMAMRTVHRQRCRRTCAVRLQAQFRRRKARKVVLKKRFRIRMAVKCQSLGRMWIAGRIVAKKLLQRRRWMKLHRPIAFIRMQRLATKKREAAVIAQKWARRYLARRLLLMRRTGALCLQFARATGLVQPLVGGGFFGKPEATVILKLTDEQEDMLVFHGPQECTTDIVDENQMPVWTNQLGHMLMMHFCEGNTIEGNDRITVAVCIADKVVAEGQISIPIVPRHMCSVQKIQLEPQGELELVVHLVAEDERDEEAWKCMSGHVKDAVDKKSGVGQICAEIWQYKDIPNAGIFAEVSLLAVVV